MKKENSSVKKPAVQLKKLSFLIGKWHTGGKILNGVPASENVIRGMDTYEWICGGYFILHRVDVFMGKTRTEAIEIIGYDKNRKSYFMKSFDHMGETSMSAEIVKSGVLKFGDNRMRSILTLNKDGQSMKAEWTLSEDGKKWKPWMNLQFNK